MLVVATTTGTSLVPVTRKWVVPVASEVGSTHGVTSVADGATAATTGTVASSMPAAAAQEEAAMPAAVQ